MNRFNQTYRSVPEEERSDNLLNDEVTKCFFDRCIEL